MKSKFMRILSLILVMSSLLSMFAIYASADEATGSNGATDGAVEDTFSLLYYRTFDEGWDIKNGMSVNQIDTNKATTFRSEERV